MGTLCPFANDCKRLPQTPKLQRNALAVEGMRKNSALGGHVTSRLCKDHSQLLSGDPRAVGLRFRPFKDLGTSR